MPRGVKRGPAEGEAEVVVRAGASPSHTTLLDDSPSQPISYHLLDHGYGATPQHQIRREAPSAPPKTSEVRLLQCHDNLNLIVNVTGNLQLRHSKDLTELFIWISKHLFDIQKGNILQQS